MDASGTLADNDLLALRRGAAMAHTVAGVTLTLRAGAERAATVFSHGDDTHRDHPASVTPVNAGRRFDACGFRQAVAAAWADHRDGRPVGLIGADGRRLTVDWSLEPSGRLLGFGGVRVHCGGRIVWALASLLPVAALSAVIAELDAEWQAAGSDMVELPPTLIARIVHDEQLDVAVVHIEVDAATQPLIAAIDELLLRMIAIVGSAELLDALASV